MSVLSGPKGTRDFYPEEMFFQQFIIFLPGKIPVSDTD
jgi:hypothetical protein